MRMNCRRYPLNHQSDFHQPSDDGWHQQEARMKLLHVALVSVLLCLPAQAQEIEYGRGLICDTQRQAEQLASHLDGDVGAALQAVNAEEHDTNACAIMTVAFVRGPALATVRNKDRTF